MSASEVSRGDARATVTVDRDGIVRQWGDVVTEVIGYSADETVGRSLNIIIPSPLRKLHWWGFDQAMKRGRLRRPTLTIPALCNDGRIVVARATIHLLPGAGERPDGAEVTIVGVGPRWQAMTWRAGLATVSFVGRFVPRSRR